MSLSHGLPLCFKVLLLLSVDGFKELRPLHAEGRGDALGRGDGGGTLAALNKGEHGLLNPGTLCKFGLREPFMFSECLYTDRDNHLQTYLTT